jgi:endonuclease YncB( thermonuclease family)
MPILYKTLAWFNFLFISTNDVKEMMDRIKYKVIFTLALIFICPAIASAIHLKIDRVYDGDTVKAVGQDIEIKVRLAGIDAPETSKRKHQPGQPFSDASKKFLAGLVLNKDVEIKGYGLGPNNRIIGEIFVDGKNINLEMIRAGLAEVYQGKSPGRLDLESYRKLEVEARNAGRGVWSQGNYYTSPKVWRKMQRKLIQRSSRLLSVFPTASHPQ